MKIKMEVAPGIPEPEIILRCAEAGEAAAGLLSRLYELAAEDTGKLTSFFTPPGRSMRRSCGCTSWRSGCGAGAFSGPRNRRW